MRTISRLATEMKEEEEEDLEDEMEDVPEASGVREEEGGGEQDHDSFQFSPD